jgi:uncharacterized BrkB/YihY/UPF0761 family membrane protein
MMRKWWELLRDTVSRWSDHKDARLGAALAYYSIFSLGPLIVIAIAIAGLVFGAEAVQAQMFGTLRALLGESGTQAIDAKRWRLALTRPTSSPPWPLKSEHNHGTDRSRPQA